MARSRKLTRAVAVAFVMVVVAAGSTFAAPSGAPASSPAASAGIQLHGSKLTVARHTRVNVRAKATAAGQRNRASTPSAGPVSTPRPAVSSTAAVLPAPTLATYTATPNVSSVGFAGASSNSLCDSAPCSQAARTGIAVGPFDVVQSTSVGFRFGDRNGYVPFDMSYADFAGLDFNSGAADGRMIFDSAHNRWIAAFVEWNCTSTSHTGYLDIAISDTTDPQWFWDIWHVDLGTNVPVAPSIGTSSDKIVVGAGQSSIGTSGLPCFSFGTNTSSTSSRLFAVDWATITALPISLDVFSTPVEASSSPWRMATVNGGSPTTSVYGIDTTSGGATRLVTVTGTVATSITATPTDLTGGGILALDSDPLGLARNGSGLATVSQTTCTPAGASSGLGCVRLSRFNATGTALVEDLAIGRNGFNDVAPALAVAGDGAVHVVYDESPSGGGAGVSSWAIHEASGAPAGQVSKPALIAEGTNAYSGHAPGGVTGLATDPSDQHAVWQGQEYAGDSAGGWTSWISKLTTGVASSAAGTVSVEAGRPTAHALAVHLAAIASSGTQMRVSNVSTTDGGGRLSSARTLQPTRDARWKLDDSGAGGSSTTGLRHVYVQFGDGDDHWSAVIDTAISYAGPPAVIRRSGASRYETAAAVATNEYSPGVGIAYVATGLNVPDALAGAGAAGHNGGPILLVTPNLPIPPATASALDLLQPTQIVVLGGTGVVSDAVKAALAAHTPSGSAGVSRIAGASRYATAAAISAATYDPGVEEVLIATGSNFPDALAGAAVAGKQGNPLLLVTSTTIPLPTATELSRLHPHRITILGGTGAVSAGVSSALHSYTDGGVFRVSGPDRYTTAEFIAETYFLPQPTLALVATGVNFPDALAGAAFAGRVWSPILLTPPTSLHASTAGGLAYLKPPEIDVLGGTGAVSSGVATSLGGYIVP
ncbi:MAG TPA: cell wall-binding repeat-containing protein [Candidatus Limnocylindrales bacterium]|nr:cell wall-binding repeat-containing protein [Candidatus Limnocylindrales bacterium]